MCDLCRIAKAVIDQKCFHGKDMDDVCGKPATMHIQQVGGGFTLACDEHPPSYYRRHFIDMHPIGPACALPMSEWVPGKDDEPSRCEITGLDESLEAVSAGKVSPDA